MKTYTIKEAADYLGVCRDAVYAAIRKNKIIAIHTRDGDKKSWKWRVLQEELERYKKIKYNRDSRANHKGDLLFDHDKGLYSPAQLAKLVQVSKQRIYYLINSKQLPSKRFGATHIVKLEDYRWYELKTLATEVNNVPKN